MTTRYVSGDVLTPGEVAALFRVDPKTITRWAKSGQLKGFKTPGGHMRFHWDEIKSHIEGDA